jgi:glycosyltransferase involved in cell wall biosynthesis
MSTLPKITFCQMTQNRLPETKFCIERILPFVDRVIIVDGGSIDDSIFYFRNWAQEEPKLEFYLHPWTDNFSAQRNNYLSRVEDNSWILVSDPDEWFENSILQNLRQLIVAAEANGKDMVGFQCRSVSQKGPKRVWENLDQYHKRLLFKKYPGTVYADNPHEHLVNHPHKIMDTSLIYEHVKQENVIWHRGTRNLFVGGGGPNLGTNNPRWIELRKICSDLQINSWHEFDRYLLRGNIDQRIKDWMISVHDIEGFDGASEHRETYKLYFRIYHPEEEPIELKGKHIP